MKEMLYAPNLVSIGVDGKTAGDYYGRLWIPYAEEAENFSGMKQLLMMLDDQYDKWNYPQRSVNYRSLVKKADETTNEEKINNKFLFVEKVNDMQQKRGKMATFVVQVKYRQQATWQGEVIWSEKDTKESFLSAWDLVKKIDKYCN